MAVLSLFIRALRLGISAFTAFSERRRHTSIASDFLISRSPASRVWRRFVRDNTFTDRCLPIGLPHRSGGSSRRRPPDAIISAKTREMRISRALLRRRFVPLQRLEDPRARAGATPLFGGLSRPRGSLPLKHH